MRREKALREGFTLIELLLVIAIIGVLTALVASAMSNTQLRAKKAVAQAELGQMQSAIDEYKEKLGFYPPDNPNDALINPLYFELLGTTNNGLTYVTLDTSGQISNISGDINSKFNRPGFANSSTRAHSTDDSGAPIPFLNHLNSKQSGQFDSSRPLVKILVCSVEWPDANTAPIPGTLLNPWRYVSSHPTNNPGSYDLWVDLLIGKKIYRVSNWSKQPQIVP
jgi:prepilin-type N-terminal cleavage/methylation domain-containing protein